MMTEAYYDESADWSLIPDHMRGAVERYVMHGIGGGSFLSALMSNDFMGAAGRADEANINALKGWATFIYNCVPSPCHGSPARVQAWINSGGIVGQQAQRQSA